MGAARIVKISGCKGSTPILKNSFQTVRPASTTAKAAISCLAPRSCAIRSSRIGLSPRRALSWPLFMPEIDPRKAASTSRQNLKKG